MSNLLTGTQRQEKHAQRLRWLIAHPGLFVRLPGATDDVGPPEAEALDDAVKRMKHERLYAPTANAQNVRGWIRVLVDELRTGRRS